MTVTWAIELDTEPAERVRAELLVAPFFEGERPLRGAAGRIDWRLGGHLSAMLERGAFRGALDEVILVPAGTRLRAPRALLVGLGPREGFSARGIQGAARVAVSRAAALRAGAVALALPSEAQAGLAPERAAAAALFGAGEALSERPYPLRLRLVLEPAGLSRARQALAELIARIEMEGVVARLAAPEPIPPGSGGSPDEGEVSLSSEARARPAPQAKLSPQP